MANIGKARAVLNWHLAMGIDETINDSPIDRFESSDVRLQQNKFELDKQTKVHANETMTRGPANVSEGKIKAAKSGLLPHSAFDTAASANTLKELETVIAPVREEMETLRAENDRLKREVARLSSDVEGCG